MYFLFENIAIDYVRNKTRDVLNFSRFNDAARRLPILRKC